MPIPAFRAKQSTETSGTAGTIVLNAAGTNARSFSAAFGASPRRILYGIQWDVGFEIGYGDFDGGTPGTLTRATVILSSNANALVTLPAGTKDVFAIFEPGAREVVSVAGNATLALADLGNVVVFTGASGATLNLPAIATVPIGAGFLVLNNGTAFLTLDASGAETINGTATLPLQPGAFTSVFRVGAGWSASVPPLPSNGGQIVNNDGQINFFNSGSTVRGGYIRNLVANTRIEFLADQYSLRAGTLTARALEFMTNNSVIAQFGPTGGLVLGSPTGGDQGGGVLNAAVDVRVNGVSREPLSQSAAGIGQKAHFNSGIGNAAVLPAGGTWEWIAYQFNSSGAFSAISSGFNAGGTTIGAATAGITHVGAWKRIG